MAQRSAGDRDAADATLALAVKTAEGLGDPDRKVEALARVAIVQADWGDRAAARQTFEKATRYQGGRAGGSSLVQLVVSVGDVRGWGTGKPAAGSP